MNFRKWFSEWEGFTFPGDDSQYYNSENYPRSKYKGPGDSKQQPKELPASQADRMYKGNKKHWLKKK